MKKPAAYRIIEAKCSKDLDSVYRLCWCSYRNEYIEPVTSKSAIPVVGEVLSWEYLKECLN